MSELNKSHAYDDILRTPQKGFVIMKTNAKSSYKMNNSKMKYTRAKNLRTHANGMLPSNMRTNTMKYIQSQFVINDMLSRLGEGADGFYTWILKRIDRHEYFICAKTRINQEVGTLHKNLDFLTKKGDVLYAGELFFYVEGDGSKRGYYNFSSGSYMIGKRINRDSLRMVEGVLGEYGIRADFLDCSNRDLIERAFEGHQKIY